MSILPPPSVLEGWDPILPRALSPSSINTFLTCSEQWRRRYLIAERERPSGFLLIGRAESKAREKDLGQKIETHKNLSISDVKILAAEAFDDEVVAEGGAGEIEWEQSRPAQDKDITVNVAAVYADQVSSRVQPAAVEEQVEILIGGLAPPVRGYLDVRQDGLVREVKTSKSKKSKPSGAWILQSAMYSAATELPTVFDVSVKTKDPYVLSGDVTTPELRAHDDGLAGERISMAATSAAGGMLAYLDRFGPDTEWPGAATQMVPPCGYCSFAPTCKWLK